MHVESTGVQETSNKDNTNKDKDDDTIKTADGDIPEEYVHHPQITSPNERPIYNLSSKKPRKNPGVEDYAYAQIVRYAMTKYSLRKRINKFNMVKDAALEKELKNYTGRVPMNDTCTRTTDF